MDSFEIKTLPAPLTWHIEPLAYENIADNAVALTAGAESDWFFDPAGNVHKNDAPVCLFPPPSDTFTLQAQVTVAFTSTYDAGVLFVYGDETHWAKLCFEFSPQRQPMVVSVVTRETSDDCNSTIVQGNTIYLRVYCRNKILAFHYSHDGMFWHFVRYFTLNTQSELRVGFSAQSPTGVGCRVVFSEIAYATRALDDLRDGS